MPAVSEAQRRFMGLCSTSTGQKKARGKCPPMKAAKEFVHKSAGKKLPEKAKKRSFSK